jgi:hypothetical protein
MSSLLCGGVTRRLLQQLRHRAAAPPVRAQPAAAASALRSSSFSTESEDDESPSPPESELLHRGFPEALSPSESRGSVLDLYRKICRLTPQVLRGYELEGEDSYHRAIRNVRFHFEHHRQLQDRHVVELLRHKAEMEIEEALLMYKTKSHIAALLFMEPQLASVARHSRQQRSSAQPQPATGAGQQQQPSPFLQDFLAGSA